MYFVASVHVVTRVLRLREVGLRSVQGFRYLAEELETEYCLGDVPEVEAASASVEVGNTQRNNAWV